MPDEMVSGDRVRIQACHHGIDSNFPDHTSDSNTDYRRNYTGIQPDAVDKFVSESNIDIRKLIVIK